MSGSSSSWKRKASSIASTSSEETKNKEALTLSRGEGLRSAQLMRRTRALTEISCGLLVR